MISYEGEVSDGVNLRIIHNFTGRFFISGNVLSAMIFCAKFII